MQDTFEILCERIVEGGVITSSMHRQQTFRCALTSLILWTTTLAWESAVGLLARSRRRRQLSHEHPPKSFHGGLSHRSTPSRLTSLIRNGLKTTSFTLSATSSVSPVRPQNRLGPPSEPKFRFRFGSPQKRGFGFGFKTDPGLLHTQLYNACTWSRQRAMFCHAVQRVSGTV